MSKVIDLFKAAKANEAYQDRLEELRGLLDDFEDELRTATINLAMAGPWKEWDAKQPVGAQTTVDMLDISNTADARVTELSSLLGHVHKVLELLGPSPLA